MFPEIVRKTIEVQFGDPGAAFRELGQNGIDAYNQAPRVIEFTTKDDGDRVQIAARDYGIGMQPREVIHNLLIPYNSGKEFDPTKWGEHGIGWFSVMDLSDRVEVLTRNGVGLSTYADLSKQNTDWRVSLDISDRSFHGTEVRLHVPKTKFNPRDLQSTLRKHMGLVSSSEVNITLNGEKINNLDQQYLLGAEVMIENGDEESPLKLYLSLDREPIYDTFILTQGGLYIKNADNPFESGLHHDFFRNLSTYGVNFWVDLPNNIGLTKGRNNIVAQDREKVNPALYHALEQAILDVILEDEKLVERLDSAIASMVSRIFQDHEYDAKEKVKEAVARSKPKALLTGSVGTETSTLVISNNAPAGRDYLLEVTRPEKTEAERVSEDIRKQYLSKVTGLSRSMLEKKFIPALVVPHPGEEYTSKVSVEDLILAFHLKSLYGQNSRRQNVGIYVNESTAVVRGIMNLLNKDMAELEKLYLEEEERNRRIEAWRNTPASNYRTKYVCETFERTGKKTFERIVEREKAGGEFFAFLQVAEYLDGLISTANNIKTNPLAIHRKYTFVDKLDIAHTDGNGISFNLYTDPVKSYIAAIRQGGFSDVALDSLLEVLLHEKGHCITQEWDPHAAHGTDFYVKKKKPLRDNLLAYLRQNSIDPESDITQHLAKMPPTRFLHLPADLAQMIEKYNPRSSY